MLFKASARGVERAGHLRVPSNQDHPSHLSADVNARKQDHWTPLRLSSWNGHVETVKILIERGTDAHARNDNEGRTPLQAALEKGHLAVVQLLSRHAAGRA